MLSDEIILKDTLKALQIISNSTESKIIDLQNITSITPFLITPIAAFFKSEDKKYKILEPRNKEVCSYLNRIHFPDSITSEKLSLSDSATYLPLFQFSKETADYDRAVGEIFKKIISKYGLEDNKSIISLFLSELIDNIREHSQSNFNFIYSQTYNDLLAISIVDRGISIPGSYELNKITFKNDTFALKDALRGISTKPGNERGTGIPNTVNWVCGGLKGSLIVISRGAGFYRVDDEEFKFFELGDMPFKGTIINILFKIPKKRIDYTKYINKPVI